MLKAEDFLFWMVHSSIFVNSKILETFWFYDFVIKIFSIALNLYKSSLFMVIKIFQLDRNKNFNFWIVDRSGDRFCKAWTESFGTITLEWFVATKLANTLKIDNSLKGQIITRSRFLWMTGLVKLFYWPVELGFKSDWPWKNGCSLKLLTWIIQK